MSSTAIIINVNTKLVSTLALLSTLRYAGMPVTLIDCQSTDGSLEHFKEMQKHHDFDIRHMELREHGKTLDIIFKSIDADKVLLVDSDVEILSDEIFSFMREQLEDGRVFGAGFKNGPEWQGKTLYCERAWIPLVMLKTEPVRRALANGISFKAETKSSILPLFWSRSFYYDTGARMTEYLKQGMRFAGLPLTEHEKYAKHFYGVTRSQLKRDDPNHGNLDEITKYVRNRLESEYQYALGRLTSDVR